jgi:two-component system nitrate/nitrite response regulator NarL
VRRTRVLVADGLAVFRAAVRNVLTREKDFDVVEAATAAEVASVIAGVPIELALVDLELAPDGAQSTIAAIRECSDASIIVWSFAPDPETVFEAIRAGASGYLAKEISPDGLVRSLRGAARGEAPLPRELVTGVIDALHELERSRRDRERTGVLSDREREVLGHVAQGARNKQIAHSLEISEFTVKRHMQNILRKLELATRKDAATFYRTTVAPKEISL